MIQTAEDVIGCIICDKDYYKTAQHPLNYNFSFDNQSKSAGKVKRQLKFTSGSKNLKNVATFIMRLETWTWSNCNC